MQFTLQQDSISPDLARKISALKDPKPVLEAMGQQLVSHTTRSFNNPSLRIKSWANKKDGAPSNLKKEGALAQSIRITQLTGSSVTVGSDRLYAAVHQLGSRKSTGRGGGIPARPFFPITAEGQIAPDAAEKIRRVARAKLASLISGS